MAGLAASPQEIDAILEKIAEGYSDGDAGQAVGRSRSFVPYKKRADRDFARLYKEAKRGFIEKQPVQTPDAPPDKMADKLEKIELAKAELARERSAVAALRTELRREIEKHDSAREIMAVVADHIQPVEATAFKAPKRDEAAPIHEWVLVLSDWHVGQLTTADETGGMFSHSTETVIGQVQGLWDAVATVHAIETPGRTIDTLHILDIGDMVDGDLMRVSQTRKVDRLVAEQYPIVAGLTQALVSAALTKFAKVVVHVVGGNHDRFGKYGDAGLGELAYIENWSYVLGTSLETTFANEPRCEVRNYKSFFGATEVAGHRFVFSHGSDINWRSNSYAGIPYFSLNVAAERMKSLVDGYDVYVTAHGHTPILLPAGYDSVMVMNGSLPGSSTYVQSKMKSIRRPSQTLLSMHRNMGLTGYHKLYADHEGLTIDAAFDTDPEPTAPKFDLTGGKR